MWAWQCKDKFQMFLQVYVVCIIMLLELAVLSRLMVLLNLVFPGRMFCEFCCVSVSWVQSLFTRTLQPLCSSVWAAETGRSPNCPPATTLCNSEPVSYLRISLQRPLVLKMGCRKLLSNGRLFNALSGRVGVQEIFGKHSSSTHSGWSMTLRGCLIQTWTEEDRVHNKLAFKTFGKAKYEVKALAREYITCGCQQFSRT